MASIARRRDSSVDEEECFRVLVEAWIRGFKHEICEVLGAEEAERVMSVWQSKEV